VTTGVTVFPTAIGPCGIAWRAEQICGVQLPERTEAATRERMLRQHPGATEAPPPPHVRAAIDRITGLLGGSGDDLRDIEVDDTMCSEFARRVYRLTRSVEPGQTTTYGEIAAQLGAPQAAREVGQALGHNPLAIIVPCHRVLGAGGKLVGFSAAGGVQTKLRMLAIEGAAAPDGQTALF
jgi:methylated-DNA-[protein]-cysteine S-methyltransferase